MKEKIAVLFGGISAEHEVSKMSAKSVMENLDKEKFEIVPVEISKDGDFDLEKVMQADVVFPVMHGAGGEDGSIQGFCEVIKKPCVGCGVEASILALDKIAQKLIFKSLNLPIPSFQFFSGNEWEKNPERIIYNIVPPVFVKPSHTGSSVGISKAHDKNELKNAFEEALKYSDQIIVEEALDNIREFEVSVLGNNENLTISAVGEVLPDEEFYTYQSKYSDESKTELVIPAKISGDKASEIQELARQAYLTLGCAGMARADFFMEKLEGKVYINELNTIPGFTSISMYPKLMEASGIPYKELLTRLIELAKER